uniref:Uncharacterized protein n=1 Tax=Romanomermis culicivorax TaxID=13658 RepID=A0A915J4Q5_ROMCU
MSFIYDIYGKGLFGAAASAPASWTPVRFVASYFGAGHFCAKLRFPSLAYIMSLEGAAAPAPASITVLSLMSAHYCPCALLTSTVYCPAL